MVWSPNSQYLAAFDNSQYSSQFQQLSSGTKVDTTVHIWDALTGEDVFVYRGHTAGVNYVAWSPDCSKIASASADKTVKVWQATEIEHITGR
jgi:WD40 repeat protein